MKVSITGDYIGGRPGTDTRVYRLAIGAGHKQANAGRKGVKESYARHIG